MIYELGRREGLMVYLQLPAKTMCTNAQKCALMCTEKKMKKIKKLELTWRMTVGVDLKSLPLAECQFESGRGHHQI